LEQRKIRKLKTPETQRLQSLQRPRGVWSGLGAKSSQWWKAREVGNSGCDREGE
jgi:hypothetical protein